MNGTEMQIDGRDSFVRKDFFRTWNGNIFKKYYHDYEMVNVKLKKKSA